MDENREDQGVGFVKTLHEPTCYCDGEYDNCPTAARDSLIEESYSRHRQTVYCDLCNKWIALTYEWRPYKSFCKHLHEHHADEIEGLKLLARLASVAD